ncbi:hypothetical protein DET61_11927 [Marinobacter nauticus]|jgi:hypothetical protein|uniref:Uncharacterized protein n=1 Tax=Marinobacter nauticus TaxID=2743 RepID=A0A368X5I3_MARNT|nr:hypothetical protein [Marinobacter nauticus]RCW63260.1 hypothetical protein DET61_11927 [Marinobacter nauticus]|tara:strand:- start:328 stop:561 length:234 start_codon:yes stop_codon:yes gene_type:complete
MALNTNIKAASIGVNAETLEAIQAEFDVYTRPCGDQECILDTTGMIATDPQLHLLSERLNTSARELLDQYIIIYLDR